MPGFGQPIITPSLDMPEMKAPSAEALAQFKAMKAEEDARHAARITPAEPVEPVEPAEPTYSTVELGITAKGDVVWTVKARAEDVHKAAADAQAIHDQLTEKYAGKTGRGDK